MRSYCRILKEKIMGNRITQRIYKCDVCGKTPEDGEYLWHMGNEVWCRECCEKEDDAVIRSGVSPQV